MLREIPLNPPLLKGDLPPAEDPIQIFSQFSPKRAQSPSLHRSRLTNFLILLEFTNIARIQTG